ncbi:UNVERIFIED_CONTAM: hypothetical protein K2H54_038580, partial [Gekko kuhli]
MEADPVLAVLLAIMAAEAHLQQFKQAAQQWAEVVTAGRLQTCAAWAHFRVRQRVRAKQRQARKRRCIRNLQILGERLLGQRWWVYPRSSDWWDSFVMHIWGGREVAGKLQDVQATMGDRRIYTLGQEECRSGIRSTFNWLVDALRDVLHQRRTEMHAPMSVAVAVWWMANNMSYRAVAHQFGLAWSTVAGIVVEVTRAITERLLERVVYLRDPDKVICDHTFGQVEETNCLLRTLIAMDAGTRVMTSTHLETRGLFDEVAGAMRSHGYRRTGEQLRAKFKREKAAFFNSLEDWRGIPPRGYQPPSFSLLRELWEQGGGDQDGGCGHQTVRQGHRGGWARGRRLDLHRTLEKSQEPMVSLIQIDSSQCIKCVEIITLDFCFVMWVDNEPTVDPVVVVSSSPDRSLASASEAES